MTHYETLGTDPGASDAEIRMAYRRASSAAHPDKGGTDAQQQEVNHAFEVLSDPKRRADYDRFGDERAGPSVERRAGEALRNLFQEVISSGAEDVLDICKHKLAEAAAALHKERLKVQHQRDKLAARQGKVRVKAGAAAANIAEAVIADSLAAMDAQLDKMRDHSELQDAVKAMLDEYEQDAPEVRPREVRPFIDTGTWFATGTTWGR